MIIKGKRIRNLGSRLRFVPSGTKIVLGVRNLNRFQNLLTKAGFTPNLETGEIVLPATVFGPISRYNALGKLLIHKDRPKETAYRMVEWHWQQWKGRDETEEKSKIVEVPYERYPRTLIPPPSVELRVATNVHGDKLLISTAIEFTDNNRTQILHIINLLLEMFGECQVFRENLEAIINAPLKQLNWTVLPLGRYPWGDLRQKIQRVIQRAPEGNQRVIESRLETINRYEPDFVAIGQAGFRGYIIFGFTAKKLFMLESAYFGNATYVLGERWEELSRLTKAEILNDNLHKDRIIHRLTWYGQVRKLLS